MCQLYKTLVRPILEYGNSVWCPRFIKDDMALEKVQIRATRLISEFSGLTYRERM